MDISTAIKERHSVRNYLDKPLPAAVIELLVKEIIEYNRSYGLNIQLITDEPQAFDGLMAHYGKIKGVKNYIALVGKRGSETQEKLGYCGAGLALLAQTLGLNTCFVALTYKKNTKRIRVAKGEKIHCVIAVGYGTTAGVAHKSKPLTTLCQAKETPPWFLNGMKSAMSAPTALNQQKFLFALDGNKVSAKAKKGFYTKIDLGIVKYFFEQGADPANFVWQK